MAIKKVNIYTKHMLAEEMKEENILNFYPEGLLFSDELQCEIKSRFMHMDTDPQYGRRIFFENAGGSLRLKQSVQAFSEIGAYPDCASRRHNRATDLKRIETEGLNNARIIFNAKSGQLQTTISATRGMFNMVGTIAENVPGKNIVTTVLEHPSVFDAAKYYCQKKGIELRVASANLQTGGIDPEAICNLIDKDTILLVFMAASNITGSLFDMETIIKGARSVNPDLYIVVDFVQHAPHDAFDVEKLNIDGANIAPYKYFGQRGYSFSYVSDRVALLPHQRVLRPGNENNWILGSIAQAQYADISCIVKYVSWIGEHFTKDKNTRDLFETGMKHIHLHERGLLHRILFGGNGARGLKDISNAEPLFYTGDITCKDLIVPLRFKNISCPKAVDEYAKRGIIVFERMANSYYSMRPMEAFSLPGVIRVSPLHCHSIKDIDIFLEATEEIAAI